MSRFARRTTADLVDELHETAARTWIRYRSTHSAPSYSASGPITD